MPANVKSMMYVGEVPWHGLGTYVGDHEVTAAQAIEAAGLDWEVELQPILAQYPLMTSDLSVGNRLIAIPDKRATVVLSSEGQPVVLGVVGKYYRPVQNRDAFTFFDQVVGEGQAIYHTAGCLGEGERVWILAKLPHNIAVRGGKEDIEQYLLLYNSHDGSAAVTLRYTPVRVVCQNTLTVALSGQSTVEFKIKHTSSFKQKLQLAQTVLGLATTGDWATKLQQQIATLDSISFTKKAMEELATLLIPEPKRETPSVTTYGENERIRRETQRGELVRLFAEGQGNTGRTRYDAYNAVTEYVDHYLMPKSFKSTDRMVRRLDSIWFGHGRILKEQALELLLTSRN